MRNCVVVYITEGEYSFYATIFTRLKSFRFTCIHVNSKTKVGTSLDSGLVGWHSIFDKTINDMTEEELERRTEDYGKELIKKYKYEQQSQNN